MVRYPTIILPLILLSLSLLVTPFTASAIVPARTVALSGERAPGTSADVRFDKFLDQFGGSILLDDTGHVAFKARLLQGFGGVVAGNDSGLWSEGATGALTLLAREGAQAPDAPAAAVFDDLFNMNSSFLLSAGGKTILTTPLLQGLGGVTSANRVGMWTDDSGGLHLLARTGSLAPSPDGANFSFFYPPTVNALGQVAFSGVLQIGTGATTAANNTGVWTQSSGSLELFVRKGDFAPGSSGAKYDGRFDSPLINANGRIVFRAYLDTAVSNDSGLFGELNGLIVLPGSAVFGLLARTGLQAPGTPMSTLLQYLGGYSLAANGYRAYTAELDLNSPGVTLNNRDGLWVETTAKFFLTTFVLLARAGDQAVDLPPGVAYSSIQSPQSDANNRVLFSAFVQGPAGLVDGTNNQALWSNVSNQLHVVVRRGDQAPGFPQGAIIFSFFGQGINNAGRIAFSALLSGNVTAGVNDTGLWMQNPGGQLQRVLGAGDTIEVKPGDIRTIKAFSTLLGSNSGGPRGFNNIDQIAFWAAFTDGSQGVFVTVGPDADGDNVNDALDLCPSDGNKSAPGQCGCGVSDADSDADGVVDCKDACPADGAKTAGGICGCGVPDADSDKDGVADCLDGCPVDPAKIVAGVCGCGAQDTDKKVDGVLVCDAKAVLKAQLARLKAEVKGLKHATTPRKKKKLKTLLGKVRGSLDNVSSVISNFGPLVQVTGKGGSLTTLGNTLRKKVTRATRIGSSNFAGRKKAALKAIAKLIKALA